jgi:hypothetical protein
VRIVAAFSNISVPYSGRKITASFSYITESGEGKKERARGSKTAQSLSKYSVTERKIPLLIST